jgi:hypothetical protein
MLGLFRKKGPRRVFGIHRTPSTRCTWADARSSDDQMRSKSGIYWTARYLRSKTRLNGFCSGLTTLAIMVPSGARL